MAFNAFGSNFLSFFHNFSLLRPFLHSTVGAFFPIYFVLFALVLFYGIALIQTSLAIPNGLFMCSFESARTSGELHALFEFTAFCVGVCVISGTQPHAYALFVRTTMAQRRITPKRR